MDELEKLVAELEAETNEGLIEKKLYRGNWSSLMTCVFSQ